MIDRIKFSTEPRLEPTLPLLLPPTARGLLARFWPHVAYKDSPPAGSTDFTLWRAEDPITDTIIPSRMPPLISRLHPRRKVQTNGNVDVTYDGNNSVYEPHAVGPSWRRRLTGRMRMITWR